jgi:hypothetical protein
VFKEPKGLPPTIAHDHIIPLKNKVQSIKLRPCKYFGLQKNVLKKMVSEMIKIVVIQQSNSPFVSLVALVKNKDNSWIFCINYRVIKKLTIKDKFSMPLVDELLNKLEGATTFISWI